MRSGLIKWYRMCQPQNLISEPPRQDIADELALRDMQPNGRLDEAAFFSRLFDLKALPTHDYRKNEFACSPRATSVTSPSGAPRNRRNSLLAASTARLFR